MMLMPYLLAMAITVADNQDYTAQQGLIGGEANVIQQDQDVKNNSNQQENQQTQNNHPQHPDTPDIQNDQDDSSNVVIPVPMN